MESGTPQMESCLVEKDSNAAYAASNIQETIPFGGGSVMAWGCVSRDFKLNLVTVRIILMGQDISWTSWKPLSSLKTMLDPLIIMSRVIPG